MGDKYIFVGLQTGITEYSEDFYSIPTSAAGSDVSLKVTYETFPDRGVLTLQAPARLEMLVRRNGSYTYKIRGQPKLNACVRAGNVRSIEFAGFNTCQKWYVEVRDVAEAFKGCIRIYELAEDPHQVASPTDPASGSLQPELDESAQPTDT